MNRKPLDFPRLLLIAASFVMGMELLRAFFVLYVNALGITRLSERNAMIGVIIVLSVTLLFPLLARFIKMHHLLALSVLLMVVSRLVLQVHHTPQNNGWIVVVVGIVATFFTWTGLLSQWRDARLLTIGALLGVSIDTVIRTAFFSWDPLWQVSLWAWCEALILCGVMLWALWRIRRDLTTTTHEADLKATFPLVVLGIFVMIQVMYLQNMGYIAASLPVQLPIAAGFILLGNALALWLIRHVSIGQLIVTAIGLAFIAFILPHAVGIVVLLIILSGHALAGMLLYGGLSHAFAAETKHPSIWRTSLVMWFGWAFIGALGGLYYVSSKYVALLPNMVPLAYGVILLLIALWLTQTGQRDNVTSKRFALVPLVLLIMPLALVVIYPRNPTSDVPTDNIRVVSYNIRYGVDAYGVLDLEDIARVIEAQDADIVALQEVGRGILSGGGTDTLEWLSVRLGMPYVYAPTHDWQIGNATLSRLPLESWSFERMPNTKRSYLITVFDLDSPLTFINTHLTVSISSEARSPEVLAVLDAWDEAPLSIIVGDMNTRPDYADTALFYDAGLVDGQAVAGDPEQMTYSSIRSLYRIDYILATPDLTFTDFAVPQTTASDHLPLIATIQLPTG